MDRERISSTEVTTSGPRNARISVVVVARDATLATTLQSLAAQSISPFEILVVDGLRSGRAGERSRRFAESNPGLAVRLVELTAEDVLRPENAAIEAALGDVVALTDDSSVPDPLWLESIARALEEPQVDAVCGWVGHRAPRGLVDRYLTVERPPEPAAHRRFRAFSLDSEEIQIANIALRKGVFEEVGGFDPAMPVETLGADLAAHLSAAGRRILYDPSVRVSKVFPHTLNAMLVRSHRIGKGHARLLRRHFAQKVQVDVAGRHWSTDSVSLRVWVDLDDPDKKLAASLLGVLVSPWLAVLPFAYLGSLAWSVRRRSTERGQTLGWAEVLGMTGLAVLESAARTVGRIRGSIDDAVVCI